LFNDNSADKFAGAVYCAFNSFVSFGGTALIKFKYNTAVSGGAVYSTGHVIFNGSSSVTFANNSVMDNGGAINAFSVEFNEHT